MIAQILPYIEGDSFCLRQPEELGHSNHPGASAWQTCRISSRVHTRRQAKPLLSLSTLTLTPGFQLPQVFAVQRFGKIKQSLNKTSHRRYFASVLQDLYQRPALCPMHVLAVTGFPVNWCDAAHAEVLLLLGNMIVMSSCPWADGYLQLKQVCCDLRNKQGQQGFGLWSFLPVFLHGRAGVLREAWSAGHWAPAQLMLTSSLSFRCFAHPIWARLKPLK